MGRIFYDSPVGLLEIVSENGAVTAVRAAAVNTGACFRDEICAMTERQLAEYFNGTRRKFDIPLALKGTELRLSVWECLRRVPFGETRSYGEIAASIGKPSASRAVGNAVGDNPVLIIIPCHRVIRSDGSIGGFSAGIRMKKYLLELESR